MQTYNCLECGQASPKSYQKSNKYCSNECQHEYQYKARIKDWLVEGKGWTHQRRIPRWAQRYLEETNGNKCSVCGLVEWQGKEIVLEVDHIDGKSYNNNVENLRLICPNCHSQTDTYKNRNIGNGRSNRTLK